MTDKNCFVSCPQASIDEGLCDCHNKTFMHTMTDTTHALQLLRAKIEGRIKALESLEINSPYTRGKIKAYNNALEDIEELRQPPVIGSVCDGCGSKLDAMDISVGVCYCCQKEINKTNL